MLLGFLLALHQTHGAGMQGYNGDGRVEVPSPPSMLRDRCGADGQNSTTSGLRVGRRDFGGSFQYMPFGCGQGASRWKGSQQPACLISLWFLGCGERLCLLFQSLPWAQWSPGVCIFCIQCPSLCTASGKKKLPVFNDL